MKTSIIHPFKKALRTVLTCLKFTWRHFFTLNVLGLILTALFQGGVNWENAFYYSLGAVLLDWFKKDMKPGLNFTYYDRMKNDHSNFGWLKRSMDPCRIGSPARHLRDLGRKLRYD